jgi:hypothetical protein
VQPTSDPLAEDDDDIVATSMLAASATVMNSKTRRRVFLCAVPDLGAQDPCPTTQGS